MAALNAQSSKLLASVKAGRMGSDPLIAVSGSWIAPRKSIFAFGALNMGRSLATPFIPGSDELLVRLWT